MPNQLNTTNIPSNRVDFIDPRTGLVSREWYRFFLNLFNLAGAGSNQITLDELQIGPPPMESTSSGGSGGSGTVTSIDVSGGTTGLTTSGGPVTTAGTITLSGTLDVDNGGTGSTTAGGARTNLGLGTMAVQNANAVAITGGTVKLDASTTSVVPFHINTGVQPTTPLQGDIWSESTGLYFHNSTYTNQLNLGANTAGVLTVPVLTIAGTGATVDATAIKAVLFSLPGWVGDYKEYDIAAATGLSLTDGVANYLVVNYNSGSPVYQITTNPAIITNSDIVGACLLWREGNQVHYEAIDWGKSTASRLNRRLVQTDRYNRASGLVLGESAGNVITLTAGVVWYGVSEIIEGAVTSAASNADFYYHSAGVWTKSTVSVYNNTQYDNGTNLVTTGTGKYTVNWVYRYLDGSGLPKLAYILGSGNYTLAQAVASTIPTPPPILSTMSILVGRIIVKNGDATATQIDSAFTQVFSSSSVTNHNDLNGLQGGTATEYYHLTLAEYTGTGTGVFARAVSPVFTTPALGTPISGNFGTGTFTWPTFNQNTTGTASNVTGVVAIANGGSGQTTAQAAMNAFAGAVTSGSYLRGNGTNVVMATIQAADVPTLNQNTTGTASNVTGTVAIVNGGTGQTTATAGFDALSPTTTKGDLIVRNGSSNTRLAVGTDTFVLTADSTAATGVKWAAASGGSSNITAKGMWENANTISTNYTITSGNNAVSAGTVTVSAGVTVTVPSGSRWVIV